MLFCLFGQLEHVNVLSDWQQLSTNMCYGLNVMGRQSVVTGNEEYGLHLHLTRLKWHMMGTGHNLRISTLCKTALLCLDVSPYAEHERTVPSGDAGRQQLPGQCCWSTEAPMTLWRSVSVKRHANPAALLSDTLPPTLGEASVCETQAQSWCHSSASHHLVGWRITQHTWIMEVLSQLYV